eukprot:snap_masked-scaffold_2-processed-gene-4.39-mRNA-1 protein AED:1.00 eAED:1.00 QI:0/-1/0/0/-1/1/1/0/1237
MDTGSTIKSKKLRHFSSSGSTERSSTFSFGKFPSYRRTRTLPVKLGAKSVRFASKTEWCVYPLIQADKFSEVRVVNFIESSFRHKVPCEFTAEGNIRAEKPSFVFSKLSYNRLFSTAFRPDDLNFFLLNFLLNHTDQLSVRLVVSRIKELIKECLTAALQRVQAPSKWELKEWNDSLIHLVSNTLKDMACAQTKFKGDFAQICMLLFSGIYEAFPGVSISVPSIEESKLSACLDAFNFALLNESEGFRRDLNAEKLEFFATVGKNEIHLSEESQAVARTIFNVQAELLSIKKFGLEKKFRFILNQLNRICKASNGKSREELTELCFEILSEFLESVFANIFMYLNEISDSGSLENLCHILDFLKPISQNQINMLKDEFLYRKGKEEVTDMMAPFLQEMNGLRQRRRKIWKRRKKLRKSQYRMVGSATRSSAFGFDCVIYTETFAMIGLHLFLVNPKLAYLRCRMYASGLYLDFLNRAVIQACLNDCEPLLEAAMKIDIPMQFKNSTDIFWRVVKRFDLDVENKDFFKLPSKSHRIRVQTLKARQDGNTNGDEVEFQVAADYSNDNIPLLQRADLYFSKRRVSKCVSGCRNHHGRLFIALVGLNRTNMVNKFLDLPSFKVNYKCCFLTTGNKRVCWYSDPSQPENIGGNRSLLPVTAITDSKFLVDETRAFYISNRKPTTPLDFAIQTGNRKMVRLLLMNGARVEYNSFSALYNLQFKGPSKADAQMQSIILGALHKELKEGGEGHTLSRAAKTKYLFAVLYFALVQENFSSFEWFLPSDDGEKSEILQLLITSLLSEKSLPVNSTMGLGRSTQFSPSNSWLMKAMRYLLVQQNMVLNYQQEQKFARTLVAILSDNVDLGAGESQVLMSLLLLPKVHEILQVKVMPVSRQPVDLEVTKKCSFGLSIIQAFTRRKIGVPLEEVALRASSPKPKERLVLPKLEALTLIHSLMMHGFVETGLQWYRQWGHFFLPREKFEIFYNALLGIMLKGDLRSQDKLADFLLFSNETQLLSTVLCSVADAVNYYTQQAQSSVGLTCKVNEDIIYQSFLRLLESCSGNLPVMVLCNCLFLCCDTDPYFKSKVDQDEDHGEYSIGHLVYSRNLELLTLACNEIQYLELNQEETITSLHFLVSRISEQMKKSSGSDVNTYSEIKAFVLLSLKERMNQYTSLPPLLVNLSSTVEGLLNELQPMRKRKLSPSTQGSGWFLDEPMTQVKHSENATLWITQDGEDVELEGMSECL